MRDNGAGRPVLLLLAFALLLQEIADEGHPHTDSSYDSGKRDAEEEQLHGIEPPSLMRIIAEEQCVGESVPADGDGLDELAVVVVRQESPP